MGSLHNDIHTWAGRARARGQDTIEIDLQTADRIVAALTTTIEAKSQDIKIDASWAAEELDALNRRS